MDDSVRYQVFISSTFEDLVDERKTVIESLLSFGYMPSGMEMFPSTDSNQFEYIKMQIRSSDFVLVILKGRYGSGFTEKEYDFAESIGKPILVFVYEPFEKIPQDSLDSSDADRTRFREFRSKVKSSRLISTWSNPTDLISKVLLSLRNCSEEHPDIGWIKKSSTLDRSISDQLLEENMELRNRLSCLEEQSDGSDLLSLDDPIHFDFRYDGEIITLDFTCSDFILAFRDNFTCGFYDNYLHQCVADWLKDSTGREFSDESVRTIKNAITIQLEALGVIRHVMDEYSSLIWYFNDANYTKTLRSLALKRQ